jgi:hypothetical protein
VRYLIFGNQPLIVQKKQVLNKAESNMLPKEGILIKKGENGRTVPNMEVLFGKHININKKG